jgi:hypothetical protein
MFGYLSPLEAPEAVAATPGTRLWVEDPDAALVSDERLDATAVSGRPRDKALK